MKAFFLCLFAVFSLTGLVRADGATVNISDVHLCCDSCVKGVNKAVATVPGVTANSDKATQVIILTAPDKATLQKAADALVAAGFFGHSSDPDIKLVSDTGAKGNKVQSLKVADVHLCCGKCVKALNAALKEVPGVTGNNAIKGAKAFTITGDFTDTDVFIALQKHGLTGKVAE